MKALTVHQPWAWLIVNGYKTIENRTWVPHYKGPILIHAAAIRPAPEQVDDARKRAEFIGVELPAIQDLPRGSIVGVAEVTSFLDPDIRHFYAAQFDPRVLWWQPGCWAWVLERAWAWREPVLWKGQQRLWDVAPTTFEGRIPEADHA